MHEQTKQRLTISIAFLLGSFTGLLGVLTGQAISQRQQFIARWRRGDQAVLRQMARFNKKWTNRVTMTVAGRRHSPYAVLRHVGRQSGKRYATPLIIAPVPGGFVIPLAYGDTSDWYHNLLASGMCLLEWQGHAYTVAQPELVDAADLASAFPHFWRLRLQRYGVSRFVKVVNVSQQPEKPKVEVDQRRASEPHMVEGESLTTM
jgi:deazaflavin-dependent oxidoreductase (nitroreductase family)